MKTVKLALICLSGIIIFSLIAFFIFKNKVNLPYLNPSPPRPASPANSISGILSKIEGNTIEITRKTDPEKTRTIKIKIDSNTKITKSFVPSYTNLNAVISPTPFILQPSDLTIGQTLIVASDQSTSADSLREFTASEIQVLSAPYTLTGKIIGLTDDTVTLFAVTDPTVPNSEKNINVRIASDVSIYKLKFQPENPVVVQSEQASVQDLKEGMTITVYTDLPAAALAKEGTDQLTARYIEIAPLPANPAAESSSVSTPQPTPNQ